ncbi:MAG: thioredoxin-like domain-containing protein [Truepera sp.]|nr:thioredoxin-like domain-containing protein [Truepera sp.]
MYRSALLSILLALILSPLLGLAPAQSERRFGGTIPAPEFPPGLDWLNVSAPLSFAQLRGKIVLLDFWTYGCINCLHVIPELKLLEEKYADELVVIGVHSGKFDTERNTDNIRSIIERYELEHPVVNDSEFAIWRSYRVRAWPSFVLIDPEGLVIGVHSGEGIYELFDQVIGGAVAEFDALGLIDRTRVRFDLVQSADTPLRFPGKVLADPEGDRLFIADSNHNRLVVASLNGRVLDVIGSGVQGLEDGPFETAQFFRPQGMSLVGGDTLYVADTENHAIRRVNLAARTVETVAGTGKQIYQIRPFGPGLTTGLNSPWDVVYLGGTLYIAMAGQHQLWAFEPDTGTVRRYAGSGREELVDGPIGTAGMNQPSGLATDGVQLFVADSEASAIRVAGTDGAARLDTIVGTGLFDFGDIDGQGDAVRLQHPLGIEFVDGLLYVADTYNNKIKGIDPATRESRTLFGTGESGWQDGRAFEARFNEPGGLSFADDRLYIADTNNHVIRVASLATGEVTTFPIDDPAGLLVGRAEAAFADRVVRLEPVMVAAGEGTLALTITLPENHRVNDLAPFSISWSGEAVEFAEPEVAIVEPTFPLEVPVRISAAAEVIRGDLVIYYCSYDAVKLCLIDQVTLEVPLEVVPEGGAGGEIEYRVVVPEGP